MWKPNAQNITEDLGSSMGHARGSTPAGQAHNVMPVNIEDILNSPDHKLKIEDTEVHMVTFVGTVEKIEPKYKNVSYIIRDDTGSIEVVQWIEGEGNSNIQVMEGNFCRVVGVKARPH